MKDNNKDYVKMSLEDVAKIALGLEHTPITDGPKIDIDKLLKEGWKYQDLPWMHEAYWDYIMKAMGEDGKDYHLLIKTHHTDKNLWRGQVVISPQGRANIAKYSKDHPIPHVNNEGVQ